LNSSPLIARAFGPDEWNGNGSVAGSGGLAANTVWDSLLDGSTPRYPDVDPDVQVLTRTASDCRLPTPDRLRAFPDITGSEIGDMSLTRVRNIEREMNLRNLYSKFEGGNSTGAQKDRVAVAQVQDELRWGYKGFATATCGNYSEAMALSRRLAGRRCLIIVPQGHDTNRVEEIFGYGAEIRFLGSDYEAACDFFRSAARGDGCDANPGGVTTALQLGAYAQIAYEIYNDLRDTPAVVAIPVSNGTVLTGLYLGFLSLSRRCKVFRRLKMVAGSAYRKNPIVNSRIKGLPECRDLHPTGVWENAVNDALINRHSTDGFRFLPAPASGLLALIERYQIEPFLGDRDVAVITGKQSL